jgi:hypothetical protein
MADVYNIWLDEVRDALRSINMAMADWQKIWPFDFTAEYDRGTNPDAAAMKANRFWWSQQNKSLKKDCREMPGCWLPRGHTGECQPVSKPTYEEGDYVKVEFAGEAGMPSEWMWVRVHRCDDDKQLVFGTLDNEPVNDYDGKIELGSELAVAYSQIREHRKPTEFTKQ